MAKFAAFLLTILAIAYTGFLVFGLVQWLPWGVIGLAIVAGVLLVFSGALKQHIEKDADEAG